ncbi:MAG: GNAT family N-acetyltransferase [Caulobacter sp.]|nr:GNAT family N-acetyltransferase [Caulobacter sp.]
MEPLLIEPAKPEDLSGLLGLYAQLHPDDPILDQAQAATVWSRLMRSEETTVLVARSAHDVVATCTLTIVPNLTRGGRAYAIIENVVTDSARRRRGVGRALLEAAARRAWEAGCYKATLATGSRREATLRFYEGAGFAPGKKIHFEASPP